MLLLDSIDYATVSRVMTSWEKCRQMKGFEEKIGSLALLKLFDLQPRTKKIFGFQLHYNPTANDLGRMGVLIHAIRMMRMFDAAFNLLGPDVETLREVLHNLGERHVRYGVSPHFFPFMGQALVFALKETLKDDWNKETELAWVVIYEQLSGEIMRAIFNHSSATTNILHGSASS